MVETSPRVLGNCDELLSLLELIATKKHYKVLTSDFRLNAQTLGSISDIYFKLQHLTSTSDFNSNFILQTSDFTLQLQTPNSSSTIYNNLKSQLQKSTQNVSFKLQNLTSMLNIFFKLQLHISTSNFNF